MNDQKNGGGMRFETTVNGKSIPIFRRPYERHLEWLGGRVGHLVPIVIVYMTRPKKGRRTRRKAEKYAKKIRAYGYVNVTIRSEKPVKETVS